MTDRPNITFQLIKKLKIEITEIETSLFCLAEIETSLDLLLKIETSLF
jgi:hypothetical protein